MGQCQCSQEEPCASPADESCIAGGSPAASSPATSRLSESTRRLQQLPKQVLSAKWNLSPRCAKIYRNSIQSLRVSRSKSLEEHLLTDIREKIDAQVPLPGAEAGAAGPVGHARRASSPPRLQYQLKLQLDHNNGVRSQTSSEFDPPSFVKIRGVSSSNYLGGEAQERLLELEQLGRGGSGEVRKALDLQTLKLVALKKVPALTPKHQASIREEIATLSLTQRQNLLHQDFRINSPSESCVNILEYYGVIPQPESVTIAMEYIHGGNLQQHVQSGRPLTEPFLRHIFSSVLEALAFLHKRGIVHRDVKPENILLQSRKGTGNLAKVKLADFGLACNIGMCDPDGCNKLLGTRRFMAPESLKLREISPASDVFAFGVTIATVLNDGVCPIPTGGYEFEQIVYADILGSALIDRCEERKKEEAENEESESEEDEESIPPFLGRNASLTLQPSQQMRYEFAILKQLQPSFNPRGYLKDFMIAPLRSNPQERPSARTLLLHEFLDGKKGQPDWEENAIEGNESLAQEVVSAIVNAWIDPIVNVREAAGFEDLAYELAVTGDVLEEIFRQEAKAAGFAWDNGIEMDANTYGSLEVTQACDYTGTCVDSGRDASTTPPEWAVAFDETTQLHSNGSK
ncbi:unnamed protein product, partial [Chrysoparadoxa australica]